MKAFLLSAGLGSRLRPLTDDLPKCLIPVNEVPLLYIWMDLLEKDGVDEVLINLHYLPEKIVEAVEKRRNKIKVNFVYEEVLKGSGGTIRDNFDFVKDEDDFFVLYSDNYTNISLKEIYDFHKSKNSVFTTYVYDTDKPKEKGIFEVDNSGKVLSFEEKPALPKSNLANAGLGVLSKEIFNYFDTINHDRDFLDFGKDIMPALVGNMYVLKSKYFIKDIGSLDDYYSVLNN